MERAGDGSMERRIRSNKAVTAGETRSEKAQERERLG